MSLPMKITKPTRRVRCHVPGCRNRDALKITRRNDVNGNPLYICEECIADIQKIQKPTKQRKAKEETETPEIKSFDEEIAAKTREKITKNVFSAETHDVK